MITATPPWKDDKPFHAPAVFTHATREEIDVCLNCTLPPDACNGPDCPFHYSKRDKAELRRRIAYLAHQVGKKQVYRAVEAIRKELER
jgi:hypothetical protein